MTYSNLTKLTLTADERLVEATRILRILKEDGLDQFSQREQAFLEQMDEAAFVTERQLLWLRDILGKVQ